MNILHTDLYQLTMAQTYYLDHVHEKEAVFEMYFRTNPFHGGYAVFAGLERVVEYINNFNFDEHSLQFLRDNNFNFEFVNYLSTLEFTGTITSVCEGEVVFANEPLMIIKAPLIQAQLIETAVLNIVNFQTLIATKASRFRYLCPTEQLFEFGTRRAQEMDAALWGARSAYIGGFDATSLVHAKDKFNIPIIGTHAHSFVQLYQDELTAFRAYAKYNNDISLLVDTYDTLKSGVVNAITVAKENPDKKLKSIRIDSGDLAYQSKKAREMLDAAGLYDTKIVVSNDLDEDTIVSLHREGAKIDSYGIGTRLITSYDQAALGGIFKLVAVKEADGYRNVIKISNNVEKITTPGYKKVYRILNNQNKSEGDYICLYDEEINDEVILFSEKNPQFKKKITNFKAINLHQTIYLDGKLVYDLPTIQDIKNHHNESMSQIWDEHKRFKNPATYYVDLSQKLFDLKQSLIVEHTL